jgi:chromate transporter
MNTSLETSAAQPPPCTVTALFTLFSTIGLSSFGGGVSGWMHRALVERRAWLTETEFAAALALARIMPGASVVNLAVLIGHRLMGLTGSIVAVLGVLAGPILMVIALAVLYRRFAGAVALDTVLAGAAAAAVGMLFSMGLNSAGRIVRACLASPRRSYPGVGSIVIVVAMFVLVGVLRLPTVPVVLSLAPCSLVLALWARRGLDQRAATPWIAKRWPRS